MKRASVVATALLFLAAPVLLPSAGAVGGVGVESGKSIFQANCAMCHEATSTAQGIGPGLKGLFKRKKMPSSDRPVTEQNVRKQILEGGGGMPPFASRLSAAEVDALIAYLKTI